VTDYEFRLDAMLREVDGGETGRISLLRPALREDQADQAVAQRTPLRFLAIVDPLFASFESG
jgi:hypothetical protein